MSDGLKFIVSREAVLPVTLLDFAIGGPLMAYDVEPISELDPDPTRVFSLFEADCAAVRATRRLEDGRKRAAIVVIRPPISHEPDDVLIDLARDALVNAIDGGDSTP